MHRIALTSCEGVVWLPLTPLANTLQGRLNFTVGVEQILPRGIIHSTVGVEEILPRGIIRSTVGVGESEV